MQSQTKLKATENQTSKKYIKKMSNENIKTEYTVLMYKGKHHSNTKYER
jgi:hypothetical protein